MRAERLEHIGFMVENMSASVKFYEDMGFKAHFTLMKKDKGSPWIIYMGNKADMTFVELVHGKRALPPQEQSNSIALYVESLSEAAAELEEKGYAYTDNGDGTLSVKDPDGNIVLLTEA